MNIAPVPPEATDALLEPARERVAALTREMTTEMITMNTANMDARAILKIGSLSCVLTSDREKQKMQKNVYNCARAAPVQYVYILIVVLPLRAT